ncbi:protein kinase C-binding protein NELL2-like [Culicoides brevitarsis]|uniref:protein kinase C-binding protein NELL2-like n=1 Tax=Culicoides brevitarsis TaxID=469753 RepID=UPI00307BBBB1
MKYYHWIYTKTSLGCAQVVVILTLAILILPVPGTTLGSGIDLLEALNLNANLSEYEGVTITQQYLSDRQIYHLQSGDRNLVLPTNVYHRAADQLRNSNDFTFAAKLRQEKSNSGTIVSFSSDNNRYLELQSSGRRDEIRFHFTYITPDGAKLVHTESFPYRLADDTWHRVALSISGAEIQLLVDCRPLYKRVMRFVPDRNFSASNLQLFIGQRNSNSHSLFKGELEEVNLIAGPYGYLSQCENMDAQCPTCGQFTQLHNLVNELSFSLIELRSRLLDAERRLSYVEECDCKKHCTLSNGTIKADGSEWDIGCSQCKCIGGQVTCDRRPCGETKCKYPTPPREEEGECCPYCKKSCYFYAKGYDHGENHILGCKNCTCIDGVMKCTDVHCPKLTCPAEQQISVTNECCKYCPGVDYCSKGHACHTNATCLNLNTKYTCACHPGFQGDGFNCSDIDECATRGGESGNHCHLNTRCKNTIGSYRCECLPGYRRLDKFNCIEIDECATNEHNCHANADCINTLGSYHCRCKEGYTGDGIDCKPVCNQTCLNGGVCTAPGVCNCRAGYIGTSCERDLDECATGLHQCKNSTTCINMPGWYYCKCKPGFITKGSDCMDIDECHLNTSSCHPTAKCVNTEGHFECQCTEEEKPDCRLSCMFEDNEIPDGGKVSPRNQPCKVCTCSRGVITCEETPCNCSTWRRGSARDLCCPQCDPRESCQHQELKHVTFRSGEQWIYQCQTCECLYGEFDCWKLECPPITCQNPLPLLPGECCPRCPGDMCGLGNSTETCLYEKLPYSSGQSSSSYEHSSKNCASCTCKVSS